MHAFHLVCVHVLSSLFDNCSSARDPNEGEV